MNVDVKVDVVDLLQLLFAGLKLTGHIGWSWWWVLAPFWGRWSIVAATTTAVWAAAALKRAKRQREIEREAEAEWEKGRQESEAEETAVRTVDAAEGA